MGRSELGTVDAGVRAMRSAGRALVIGAGLLFGAPAAAADDFARGLSAYNAADYQSAFETWYPLADENDPKAQTALAFLYLKGLGVRQDDVRAADWYRRAAQLGRPEAQFFLGTLYYLGRGVPQNDTLAHVWCEIALARGMPQGLDCRDAASGRMTAAEVRDAYRTAARWLERHPAR
jgi:TPR repeat protein